MCNNNFIFLAKATKWKTTQTENSNEIWKKKYKK